MIDLTPIDIASAGLVSGTTTQEADVRRDLERNRLNNIKKPEDQVQGLPHGGIQAPTGDVPSDMPHDQILPKAIERRASTCSAKTMAEDKTSLSDTADYLRKEEETKGNGYQHKSKLRDLSESDALLSVGKKRERWFQVWRPKHGPRRPPKSLDDATEIPLAKANFLSQLFYSVSRENEQLHNSALIEAFHRIISTLVGHTHHDIGLSATTPGDGSMESQCGCSDLLGF